MASLWRVAHAASLTVYATSFTSGRIERMLSDMKEMEVYRRLADEVRKDRMTIANLAALLANGVEVSAGEVFPNRWEETPEGRARKFTEARQEHLAAARSLLGWDGK